MGVICTHTHAGGGKEEEGGEEEEEVEEEEKEEEREKGEERERIEYELYDSIYIKSSKIQICRDRKYAGGCLALVVGRGMDYKWVSESTILRLKRADGCTAL